MFIVITEVANVTYNIVWWILTNSFIFIAEIPLDIVDVLVLPIHPIVRGYTSGIVVTFKVTNIHPSFTVMPPLHNGTNFNYTIYLDEDSTMANNLSDNALGPFLAVCNATASALAPNTTTVARCELNVVDPRAECWQLTKMCVRAAPSEDGGASYTEHNYIKSLACTNISAMRNCLGKVFVGTGYYHWWWSLSFSMMIPSPYYLDLHVHMLRNHWAVCSLYIIYACIKNIPLYNVLLLSLIFGAIALDASLMGVLRFQIVCMTIYDIYIWYLHLIRIYSTIRHVTHMLSHVSKAKLMSMLMISIISLFSSSSWVGK